MPLYQNAWKISFGSKAIYFIFHIFYYIPHSLIMYGRSLHTFIHTLNYEMNEEAVTRLQMSVMLPMLSMLPTLSVLPVLPVKS